MFLVGETSALLGFDCGGSGMNVTTMSLLDTGDCDMPITEPRSSDVYVQLLQLAEFENTQVSQCRVEIDRTIYYCGMSSHISIVQNGRRVYLMDVPLEACRAALYTGAIAITPSAQVFGIKANMTQHRSLILAGSVGTDGRCSGTQYADPYGTWDGVVVQASVKIIIRQYKASVKIRDSTVVLQSGSTCTFTDGSCITDEDGSAYWMTHPESTCNFNHYNVLFEGIATKLTPMNPTEHESEVYTMTTGEITFALEKRAEYHLCGYTLLRTEHPKLFILETEKGRTFSVKARVPVENLDLFAYINTKFVYVEKNVKTQMTTLYRDVMHQKCQLERQVLKNALALASLLPDEFAYTIMRAPGYMAVVAGEVIHIVKCTPVAVRVRHMSDCYQELPVYQQNNSMFLNPKSRILLKTGTIRECTSLLPQMFQIEGTWYRLTPKPVESLPPQMLQPMSRPTWKYIDTSSLATSGIYSQQELDNLRDHIMFPAERPSVINTIARGATGRHVPQETVSMLNLLNEADINRITENAVSKLWDGFLTFGSASAGVIGLILIFRGVKLCVDAVIRGYTLHTVYGWSIHLIGAIWSSVTNLLLHLGGKRSGQNTTPEDQVNPATDNEEPSTSGQGPKRHGDNSAVIVKPKPLSEVQYPILDSIRLTCGLKPHRDNSPVRLT